MVKRMFRGDCCSWGRAATSASRRLAGLSMAWVLGHGAGQGAGQGEPGVVGALAGAASVAGVVSNARQRSRSLVSAALQLGEQIEGCGVWRALSGSGASLGGGTVGGDVVGEVAAQPASSSAGSIGIRRSARQGQVRVRSEEHTSELQSPCNLVCRLLLEKKNTLG